MIGLAARLLGGLFTPLLDKASETSARLLRKLALFLVAALAMVVVVIALTVAFGLWIASLAGPIVGVLAIAGLYFAVAVLAVGLALWGGKGAKKGASSKPGVSKSAGAQAGARAQAKAQRAKAEGRDAQIDDFAAPLLAILQRMGLRREQIAVLAGTSVAKQLGPVPLVGLAIVAGFLVGRLWDGWRSLVSMEALTAILSSGLFARKDEPDEDSEEAG